MSLIFIRYELLTLHLRYSKAARAWFCQEALFAHPSRFCEYILECPTAEVRQAFVRIIVVLAHFSLNDGPYPIPKILLQQEKAPGNIFKREHRYALLATVFFLPDDFPKILGDFFALELNRKVSLQLFRHFSPRLLS